jgi:hypothetical protein
VWFVAVPADADASVVLGAEDLGDPGLRTAKPFDVPDQRNEPWRDWIGLLQTSQRVVVAEPKRCDAPLVLILAELKGLQRSAATRSISSRSVVGEMNSAA